jgi:hypothetical protein
MILRQKKPRTRRMKLKTQMRLKTPRRLRMLRMLRRRMKPLLQE